MKNRVYCLYRVSTMRQADFDEQNRADIPVQRNACHEFAAKMGWEIIHQEQETSISGFKVSAEERDKLQLIKNHALQNKFDILLVFMFDQIGRKADESPFVVEWFVRNGIQVWSVKEGEQRFDQHIDTLLNYIRFWQADGESRKTSIRTKEGLRQLVLNGGYRGGGVPYGYRLEPTGMLNKRKKETFALAIDEDEAIVVRKMFELCVGHGFGRFRIAMELNRQGLSTRRGGRWHEASIGHILHDCVYTGVLRNGETTSQPFEHLMIISPEIFEQTQKIHEARKNHRTDDDTLPVNTTGNALLSGNVYCGHCGGRLVLTSNCKTNMNASGERVKYQRIRYVCYQKTRQRRECNGQTGYTSHILDDMIDKMTIKLLKGFDSVEEQSLLEDISIRKKALLKKKIQDANQIYKDTLDTQALLKEELIKTLHATSVYPPNILAQMLHDSEIKAVANLVHLESLREELALSRKQTQKRDHIRFIDWADIYENSDTAVKKMITCYLMKKIHVFRDY